MSHANLLLYVRGGTIAITQAAVNHGSKVGFLHGRHIGLKARRDPRNQLFQRRLICVELD